MIAVAASKVVNIAATSDCGQAYVWSPLPRTCAASGRRATSGRRWRPSEP